MEAVLFLHDHRFCTKMFHKCIFARRRFATNFFPEQPIILCLFVDNEHMVGQFGIVWPYLVIRDFFQTIYILSLRCDYSVITERPFVTLFCHQPPQLDKVISLKNYDDK